jgi:hypothetical protein
MVALDYRLTVDVEQRQLARVRRYAGGVPRTRIGRNVVRARPIYLHAIVDESLAGEGARRALRSDIVAVHVAEPRGLLRDGVAAPTVRAPPTSRRRSPSAQRQRARRRLARSWLEPTILPGSPASLAGGGMRCGACERWVCDPNAISGLLS